LAKTNLTVFFSLLSLVLLPSVGYSYGANSLAFGLLLWTLVQISLNYHLIKKAVFFLLNTKLIYILIFITTHYFVVMIFNRDVYLINFDKFLVSLILINLIFITSFILNDNLRLIDNKSLNFILNSITYFYLFILVLSFLFISPFFPNNVKAVIFFSEPSHYALSVAPFFIYSVLQMNVSNARLILLLFLIMTLIIQNATLLIIITFGIIIHLFKTYKNLNFLILCALFIILLFSFIGIDFDYYLDRFIYSSDNYNMSLLVYLSGWERSLISIQDTLLFGVGFQQFGFEYLSGFFYDRLLIVGGNNLNIYDGASVGSKLVGEFGIFGIFFIMIYIFYFIKIFFGLFRKNLNSIDSLSIFYKASFLAFSFCIFIRGTGYFSELTLLFFSSVIYMFDKFYEIKSSK
jgi:hypothetical protein